VIATTRPLRERGCLGMRDVLLRSENDGVVTLANRLDWPVSQRR
jgi:hypothetical protein